MKVKYKVESDDLCPNCAAKIEEAVKKIDGVNDANLSFLTLKLKMELADGADEDDALAALSEFLTTNHD